MLVLKINYFTVSVVNLKRFSISYLSVLFSHMSDAVSRTKHAFLLYFCCAYITPDILIGAHSMH